MVDSQSSLRFGDFPAFLEHAGIGLTVIPGEAHWMHGKTEAMVQIAKRTMKRIRNDEKDISPAGLAALTTMAQNNTDRISGFSPVQWAYGYDPMSQERDADPLLANREKLLGPQAF